MQKLWSRETLTRKTLDSTFHLGFFPLSTFLSRSSSLSLAPSLSLFLSPSLSLSLPPTRRFSLFYVFLLSDQSLAKDREAEQIGRGYTQKSSVLSPLSNSLSRSLQKKKESLSSLFPLFRLFYLLPPLLMPPLLPPRGASSLSFSDLAESAQAQDHADADPVAQRAGAEHVGGGEARRVARLEPGVLPDELEARGRRLVGRRREAEARGAEEGGGRRDHDDVLGGAEEAGADGDGAGAAGGGAGGLRAL